MKTVKNVYVEFVWTDASTSSFESEYCTSTEGLIARVTTDIKSGSANCTKKRAVTLVPP